MFLLPPIVRYAPTNSVVIICDVEDIPIFACAVAATTCGCRVMAAVAVEVDHHQVVGAADHHKAAVEVVVAATPHITRQCTASRRSSSLRHLATQAATTITLAATRALHSITAIITAVYRSITNNNNNNNNNNTSFSNTTTSNTNNSNTTANNTTASTTNNNISSNNSIHSSSWMPLIVSCT